MKAHDFPRALVIAFVAVGALAITAGAQAATTWYVAPAGSNGNSCQAPAQACATIDGAIGKATGGDTVRVAVGTYTGAGDQVVTVNKQLVLEGGWDSNFATRTGTSTIDGQDARRGLQVASAAVRIERFTIENGVAPLAFSHGGGILVGGPAAALGVRLELDSSVVRESQSGGIWSEGPLLITNSTISGNTSSMAGGGIVAAFGAQLTLRNSTVSGNETSSDGGGIFLEAPPIGPTVDQFSNVTVSGNDAGGGSGGGIWVGHDTRLHFRNSIVADNSAAISQPDFAAQPPEGTIISEGYNIGTGFTTTTGDTFTFFPLLAPLAANGGPTPTRALLPGSPAVDAGNPTGCADENGLDFSSDQRGVARPLGYACDIGAVEAEPPLNDDFADATQLDLLASPLQGSNAFGTKEPGEPDHAMVEGGASIWYSWTAPFSGAVYISTEGSSIDSLLGVYTGGAVSSLTPTAMNDDAHPSVRQSKACFTATGGTTYRIAVDGFDAGSVGTEDEGDITLSWGPYVSSDPCPVLPPQIGPGPPQVGKLIGVTVGTWAGLPSGFRYQWGVCDEFDCFAIPNATFPTYTPDAEDEGLYLVAAVTAKHASNPALDVTTFAPLTAPVQAAPPQPPAPQPPAPQPPAPQPPAPQPPPPPKTCLVPKVKGKPLLRARQQITRAHCRVGRIDRRYSRSVQRGRVISQKPRAGSLKPLGAKVSLVVSRGRKR